MASRRLSASSCNITPRRWSILAGIRPFDINSAISSFSFSALQEKNDKPYKSLNNSIKSLKNSIYFKIMKRMAKRKKCKKDDLIIRRLLAE